MAPGKANLAIYQGDDYAQSVLFVTGEGAPFDISGLTFSAQIRADYADAAPVTLAELTCTVVDPDTGELTITLDHEVTESLPTTDPLRWDLQSADPTGEVFTYLAGTVKVTAEVTR